MAVATILMVAATALSAVSQMRQGQAADATAKYNATVLEQNATAERQQASAREEQQRRQAAHVLGLQRAAYAQAGGGTGGSALDVATQSGRDAELDALTLRYEGGLRARGLESEAAMERFSGRQALSQSRMAAVGTIIGGAGNYMSGSAASKARTTTLNRMR